jgi:DNA-binding HxlR family transcriptional regulator
MTTPRRDPTTLAGRPCSAASALDVVGDRWALLAIREVTLGNHRFSQIARNTGAPRDRLAARLKALVEAGILRREAYQDSPRREEYQLTDAGRDLARVTQSLLEWGDRWAVTDPPVRLRHHGHELVTQVTCRTCGEPVRREDVTREYADTGWDNSGRVAG